MIPWLGICRLALANLTTNKLRSALTILGMVFGTGAVIATLSSNEGAGRFIQSELKKLGTNTIVVVPNLLNTNQISEKDRDYLRKYADTLKNFSLMTRIDGTVGVTQGKISAFPLVGAEPEYFTAFQLGTRRGRLFDELENSSRELVAVVGSRVREALFQSDSPVGKLIHVHLNETLLPVRVIGELREKGGAQAALVDQAVYLPFLTAKKFETPKTKGTSFLAMTVHNENQTALAKEQIQALLARQYPMGLEIADAREAIERTQSIWQKQNLVGICLALISLFTGGVGIMNIMLLSVSQRRKEIGLRKAVGARNSQVLAQFLLESALVCFAGGLTGILFGLLFGKRVAQMMGQWEAQTSLVTVLWTMFFSTLIGVVFGLLPALRASRIAPYDALRS